MTNEYDMIFVDQYMPALERPLLGTEVIRQLRAAGSKCIMCGLSANDMKDEFLASGANAFRMKPFSCEKARLKKELLVLLDGANEPR